jgi:hypothetical protein
MARICTNDKLAEKPVIISRPGALCKMSMLTEKQTFIFDIYTSHTFKNISLIQQVNLVSQQN